MDPLDPSLAPLLVFGSGHGGAEAREEKPAAAAAADATFLYSIPKRQLLPAAGFAFFLNRDDVHWITPQGWVLTLDPSTRDASLRDPFTSRSVRLPQDRDSLLPINEDTRCLLSTCQPADDPAGCVVLVIHLKRPVLWHCSIIPGARGGSGGISSWSRHEYPHELIAGDMWVVSMLTAASGKFYTCAFAEDYNYKLLTLEFSPAAGPVFSAARAVPSPWLAGCFRVRVVESCGDLYAVRFNLDPFRGREVVDIYVYKLVMSSAQNAWVKVYELGDDGRVFFLGKGEFGASMAADDEVGLEANCIYFTNEDDKGPYVYDMERGSISLHNPGPDVPDSTEPMVLMHATRVLQDH